MVTSLSGSPSEGWEAAYSRNHFLQTAVLDDGITTAAVQQDTDSLELYPVQEEEAVGGCMVDHQGRYTGTGTHSCSWGQSTVRLPGVYHNNCVI